MALQSFVNSIVFSPPGNANALQSVQLLQHKQYMDFVRKASGQRIAYYHMAPGGGRVTADRLAEVTHSSTVMLFHHGNAEDLGGCYHYAEWLAASFGVAVIMYDYCGYGFSGYAHSQGPQAEVTEKSVYSDADDMYGHVLNLGYAAHRIVLVGRSVGGGPACYLAQKHHKEIAGLILISTFTSCLRVVSSCCLPYFCCCVDLFPNYRRVEGMTECPVLVMHGTNDRVVPYHCSCELLDNIDERRSAALQRLQRHRRRAAAKQAASSDNEKATLSANSTHSAAELRPSMEEVDYPPVPGEPDSVFDLYRRAYAAIPVEVRTVATQQVGFRAHDVHIGAFHKWLPGCGHNDIENRQMEAFAQALMWFVRFAKAFSAQRAMASDGAKSATAAPATRE